MAETAKILSPEKTVVLPDLEAGCSWRTTVRRKTSPGSVRSTRPCCGELHQLHGCGEGPERLSLRSGNAVDLVKQLPADQPVLFAPDQNLGRWVQQQSGRERRSGGTLHRSRDLQRRSRACP